MPNYETNTYNYLKRKGFDKKYEFAGIYCIKIDNDIVYIGKSTNMLKRISQHYAHIRKNQDELKYKILAEAHKKGHSINFDVLYRSTQNNYYDINNEIGIKEGEYIRQYEPVLNTQIPNEIDYHKYTVRKINAQEILEKL